ncbi:MAG TPA: nuclear transport factor 2 family protein [Thermodesulfobacteriota bacterium]
MIRISVLIICLIILLDSCGNSDRKGIESILSQRQSALETKNLELYLECISPGYRAEKNGEVIDLDALKKQFETNVSLFDDIQISSKDQSIYIEGNTANVAQRTDVKLRIDKDKGAFRLSENLVFEKIDGKWRIIKESDADFLDGFVFGGKR